MELVNTVGRTLLAFVFVLGVMIFVHELGHYLMAKLLKIRVEVFSLGFGPRLVGFKRGGTDYRVSALPLGGYVKMAGENYDEELLGTPDEFLSRPKLHRFSVAVAGPVMNLCLAVFLVWLHFVSGVELESYVKQPAVIGRIDASSPAAKAGIQPKDRIMAVNGKLTPSWREAQLAIARNPNRTLSLTIDRAGRRLSVETTPAADKELGVGTLGIGPSLPFVVGSVEPGSPAAQADLRPGDRLLEVIGRNRTAYEAGDVTELIGASRGQSLRFRIDRRGRTIEKTIAPVQMREGVRIGIARQVFTVTEKYGPVEAIGKSLEHNYRVTTLTFGVLGRIITGKTSLRTMSGPIEIARYSGMAAREGAVALMSLMALISLQLGIFNLLPIPILDGGVIALLLVEGLMRRDLSMKVKERIFQVGFIFLVLLMGIIIFNDISKHFSHL